MAHTISILYGSVRKARLGIRVVAWLRSLLEEHGYKVEVVDQADYAFPVLEVPFHHYEDPAQAPENVRRAAEVLTRSDGFVVVTGEYNHATQPGLINILDHFHRGQFGYKPSMIASYSYGQFAGVRAATLLRPVLAELGTVSIPTSIAVPSIMESLNEDGVPQKPEMAKFAGAAISELDFYVKALAQARPNLT